VRRRRSDDPFAVLGLPAAGVTPSDVIEARRRLAKISHPDVGGDAAEMQRVNEAAEAALRLLAAAAPSGASPGASPGAAPAAPRPSSTTAGARRFGPTLVDHPSFTIEALPAEAFEGLLVVTSWYGDLAHDDPPYAMEVLLHDPTPCWCRIDLVPDAGASSVSLAVAAEPGGPAPDVEVVRDLLVEGLNRLDWSDLDAGARRPLA
jgi:hypothetical protein